jgi:hypothetical protein
LLLIMQPKRCNLLVVPCIFDVPKVIKFHIQKNFYLRIIRIPRHQHLKFTDSI